MESPHAFVSDAAIKNKESGIPIPAGIVFADDLNQKYEGGGWRYLTAFLYLPNKLLDIRL